MNGRNYTINDFTCIRPQGASVVDYCVVPYEQLYRCSDFKVIKARDLITLAGLLGSVDVSRGVPDHSVLKWRMEVDDGTPISQLVGGNSYTERTHTFTKYDVSDINSTFAMSEDTILALEATIASIDKDMLDQDAVDNVYDDFCCCVREQMAHTLPGKSITIRLGVNNKQRRIKKPWWSDQLSELWNEVVQAERKWLKTKDSSKRDKKAYLNRKRKSFSRCVQRSKRQYWTKCQYDLLDAVETKPQTIWQTIGKIGVGAERRKPIPVQVVTDDGEILSNHDDVLDRWRHDFNDLLNPVDHEKIDAEIDVPLSVTDSVLDVPLERVEFDIAVANAKRGKASGHDQLPMEIFTHEYTADFLFRLCAVCFESGKVPTAWNRGIITPIPKSNMADPRNPKDYRGITLAPAAYKLYCSILNKRLSTWIEHNDTLADEQNGFRKGRSTIDHIGTLTNIIETRKRDKLSTYTVFIDLKKAYDSVNRNLMWHKLRDVGVQGTMYRAILSIYEYVSCCVRVNGIHTDWFNVTCGLKQGCPMSPVLFNIFIDDLARALKATGKGVEINGERVCLLLYADDLVLLSESERDLQVLLDTVGVWCQDNKMSVNPDKSKVVHFRPPSASRTDGVFTCGTVNLDITDRYTYLGLVLSEHLDYSITAKCVSQAAGRALGLVIAKCKTMGGMPYGVFTKLYDAMVWPVISYGTAIWGTSSYSCINAVQHRAARFYLGLGKYAPNAAVNGEIGWKPPYVKQMRTVSGHWYRCSQLDGARINRRVFDWANTKAGHRCKNWNYRVSTKLDNIGIVCDSVSKPVFCNGVESKLMREYIDEWTVQVNRDYADNRVNGGNKLRRYRHFKSEFVVEDYVKNVMSFQHRSAMAKFRCGVAPIRIETGRYEGLDIENRTCFNCCNQVEDELHVLLQCPAYDMLRLPLLNEAQLVRSDFYDFTMEQQFNFIFASKDMFRCTAKTCCDIINYRRKLLYVV